jgi:hypothetical protein
MRIAILAPILAATVLAGCDSAGVATSAEQDYNTVAQAYDDMRLDVLAMPVSSGATMPNRGGATYDGYSTISINPGTSRNTALVGEATLRADFGNGSITGTLDDFVGQVNGGTIQEYAGSIGIRDGEIGEVRAENLTADIKGAVSVAGGDSVAINGGIEGRFRDDGARNAAALTAVDTAATQFRVNNVLQSGGTVNIVAERP